MPLPVPLPLPDLGRKLVPRACLSYRFGTVARLLWRDAQGIEGTIDLGATEIRVGRAMDCAIRTDDAMVSRHHARVTWGGGGYVVEVQHTDATPGKLGEEAYDSVRCASTLFVRVGEGMQGPPQPALATPKRY